MAFSIRSILITGASRGLGLEFTKHIVALPSAPEVVIAACRDPKSATNLQELAKSHPCVKVIKLDVEKDEDIESAYKETEAFVGDRGLNVLVNNAGLNEKAFGGGIYTATRDRMQRHFDVNVSGPILITQKFIPLLKKAAAQKSSADLNIQSSIFMISSKMGSQTMTYNDGQGVSLHYKCSKTAVTMATILLARELREEGIYVGAIHPGWVQTDMGGAHADVTKEDSIVGCLKLMGSASERTNGKLFTWEGKELPY